MWSQSYFLWGQGLAISALIAAVPIFLLFYLLGIRRKPAWQAALWGLGATVLLATAGYGFSLRHTLSSALYGAAFGVFPITWIIFWAIMLYRISVQTGKFEIIKESIGAITSDMRLQILLIAFAFGAFLEGGAGFGTPVAIAAAMMTGFGFSPFYASGICLLANTVPVAFGSIGIPVVTLSAITGLPLDQLSANVGKLCAPVSFVIPTYLIAATAGRSALFEIWPALLVCGGTFAGVQFFASNYIGPQLTDILSSLSCIGALIALLRFWKPKVIRRADALLAVQTKTAASRTPGEIALAWSPYALLVVFVLAWGYKPVQQLLNSVTVSIHWPGLHNEIQRMPPVVTKASLYGAVYNLNWLSASGTSCMFAVLLSAIILRMRLSAFGALLLSVAKQIAIPTVTVAAVLAMAFVMNYCGATGTLGLAFAATGVLFPFFSAFIGWLGVFLTGSDTSANALFGNLQVVTAGRLGLAPVLLAAANSVGGVMGKMISLQTITVAAAATGLSVSEQAKLFRFTLRHSLILTVVIGIEVLAYAYIFRS
ncbi:MAG: lactate permease LctP family transporter [Acidobacteriaceae bacterium]|nr:lactate permease LctP family transporter [Acidobacteriaceae bacterium]